MSRADTTLCLPAELTFRTVAGIFASLQRELEPARRALVDVSGVRNIDTAGLALLLELKRGANADGRGIAFEKVSAPVQRLAEFFEIEDMLDLPVTDSHGAGSPG